MKLVRTETNQVILENVRIARSFWQKFKGLMMDDTLQPNEGLWIEQCRSIHTCFMKIPIDVLFVSEEGRIVHLEKDMRPWRTSKYVKDGAHVMECVVGTIDKYALQVGELVSLRM